MLLLNSSPVEIATMLFTLVVAFSVHEFAHAWTALKLGDDTAYLQGRVTLDPRSHIDATGALLFLIAGFGWARPVPIDPQRLGRQGTFLVSLAGPASNFGLAILAAWLRNVPLTRYLQSIASATGSVPPMGEGLWIALQVFVYFNVLLGIFNLLPFDPLDGWKVLIGLLPSDLALKLMPYQRYGMPALFILMLGGQLVGSSESWLFMIIGPPIDFLTEMLLGMGLS